MTFANDLSDGNLNGTVRKKKTEKYMKNIYLE